MSASILAAVMLLGATDWTCVIWLHADWCEPCQQMKPLVNKLVLAGEPIVPVKVDGPDVPWKAKDWNAKTLPASIAYVHGKEVGRVTGKATERQLRALLTKVKAARSPPRPSASGSEAQSNDKAPIPDSLQKGRQRRPATSLGIRPR